MSLHLGEMQVDKTTLNKRELVIVTYTVYKFFGANIELDLGYKVITLTTQTPFEVIGEEEYLILVDKYKEHIMNKVILVEMNVQEDVAIKKEEDKKTKTTK